MCRSWSRSLRGVFNLFEWWNVCRIQNGFLECDQQVSKILLPLDKQCDVCNVARLSAIRGSDAGAHQRNTRTKHRNCFEHLERCFRGLANQTRFSTDHRSLYQSCLHVHVHRPCYRWPDCKVLRWFCTRLPAKRLRHGIRGHYWGCKFRPTVSVLESDNTTLIKIDCH